MEYTRPNGLRPSLAIFPVTRGGKKPAIPKEIGGRGCLDATTDEETVKRWWQNYPGSNIGLATGNINGFLVIDVDIKPDEGKYGDESLRELEVEYGPLPQHTWESITPSKGRHLFFKMPEGVNVRNSEGVIAPWIDIRGNGGYVVAPGSILPYGKYQWEAASIPAETELAELPPAWVELLKKKSSGKKSGSKKFKLPEKIEKGKRNKTLFRYGSSLRAKNLDEMTILACLKTVNLELCTPPLDEADIMTILGSVLNYPPGSSRIQKMQLTLEILEQWLDEHKISVRRNLISHSTVVEGVIGNFNPETLVSELHIIIHDQLKQEYACDRSLIADLLSVVAGKNRFNPVLDMLKNAPPWDRTDRLPLLYQILYISEEDILSRTLLHKWLWQTRALLNNDINTAFGADGMLVLNGPQGIGKTSFARKLAVNPEFVKLGQYIDSKDKDTVRRATSCWIAELGEVETTLRSDLERLKAFITAEIDEYRLPYGRTDVTLVRRTSLIATCNSERFLIDPTGSRRFWTIPLTNIDLAALNQFDFLQLWKQIEEEIKNDPQCFRLTAEEQQELALRNTVHEKYLKSQAEIEDIFNDFETNPNYYAERYITVTKFKEFYPALTHYTSEQIGKALDRLGKLPERKRIDGKVSRVRLLPEPLYPPRWSQV